MRSCVLCLNKSLIPFHAEWVGIYVLAPPASTVSAAAPAHACLAYSLPCDLILALPPNLVPPLAAAC
ncbi:hypothetical protein TSMEX_000008 [Taenia solium]|eukprot:TsM_000163500 transcript=TsM_000163500 gene=TsM_000163500